MNMKPTRGNWSLIVCAVSLFLVTHLGAAEYFGGTPYVGNTKTDGITVSFIAAEKIAAKVHYGESKSYGNTAEVSEFRPGTEALGKLMYDKGAFIAHKTRIRGLKPGTKYFYKIEGPGLPTYEAEFYTMSDSKDTPLCFVFGGDTTLPDDGDMAFVESKIGKHIDFYLDNGDHITARFGSAKTKKKWLERIPWIVSKGNHDNSGNYKEELETVFDFDGDKLRFTVAWGPLFLIADGYSVYGRLKPDVLEWCEGEYKKAKQPWKAYASHGIFFSDSDHRGEGPARVAQMWPMFKSVGVQLAITAHDHDYQRTNRVDQEGKPDPKGTMCAVMGGMSPDLHMKSPWAAFQWPPVNDEDMRKWVARKMTQKSRNPRYKEAVDAIDAKMAADKKAGIPMGPSVKDMPPGSLNAVPFILIKGDTARLELWTGSGSKRVLSDSYELKLP
jgi:hypothetical protein